MSDDHSDDAHYLHRKRGLSLLVKPPVKHGRVMAWERKGALLVGTRDGKVERVHPAMGTSHVLQGLGAAIGLGVDGDQFVVVEEGGRWGAFDAAGNRVVVGAHPFEGPVTVTFRGDRVLLTGTTKGEKQVLFYERGRKVFRIRLPHRAVAFVLGENIGLAQSSPVGLEVIKLADGARFREVRQTDHELVASGDHVLGLDAKGVRVWPNTGGRAVEVSLPDAVTAGLTPDGRFVAAGTSNGGVAVIDLTDEADRRHPTTVHVTEHPIRAVAVNPKGTVLASSADALALWSWE